MIRFRTIFFESRDELMKLQDQLGADGYIEEIWRQRGEAIPKQAQGAWPFVRVEHQSNVTKLRKR